MTQTLQRRKGWRIEARPPKVRREYVVANPQQHEQHDDGEKPWPTDRCAEALEQPLGRSNALLFERVVRFQRFDVLADDRRHCRLRALRGSHALTHGPTIIGDDPSRL